MQKIFIVTISEVDDYNEIQHKPRGFTDEEKAKDHLRELYEDADSQIEKDWEREKDENSFSIYLMGEYSCNHYCACIDEITLE